jgi:uncharacterized Fe-S cluster-containing radical SAM superfamily protein
MKADEVLEVGVLAVGRNEEGMLWGKTPEKRSLFYKQLAALLFLEDQDRLFPAVAALTENDNTARSFARRLLESNYAQACQWCRELLIVSGADDDGE